MLEQPRSRFSEEQIIGVLEEAETGAKVTDLCRTNGISANTFYRWAERILRVLDQAIELYEKPSAVRTDNGPEFASRAFDAWAYPHDIEHRFILPGKPVENAYAESFNSRVRDECLNLHCFESPSHARELIEDWRADYNELRPHTALGGRTPSEYLQSLSGGSPQAGTAGHLSHQPQPARANA